MPRRSHRVATALVGLVALVGGYAAADAHDVVPGVLTTKPLPPPPPTETLGTRTLPVVPQPTTTAPKPLLPDLSQSQPVPAKVAARLKPVLALPAMKDVAFVVQDGQGGAVLAERGSSSPQVPASTTKLLSAVAIADIFPAEAVLTTKIVQGPGGGNSLVLVAGGDTLLAPGKGDPTKVAGHAGLGDLAEQVATVLRQRGVENVTLDIDTSYAAGPTLAPTWAKNFHPDGITGAVAMLGRSDQRAVPGRPGPADPVAATRAALVTQLKQRGITVMSGKTGVTAPAGAATLASVDSAPVRDQLALALTESDNSLTETLARQGAFRDKAGTGFAQTGAWIARRAARTGVPMTGVKLVDASGLSKENRIPPVVLSRTLVLAYSGKLPALTSVISGLPVSGVTGTLADRFAAGSTALVAGRAHAKTGTLTGHNALAGSVVDDDGRLLVYAAVVNTAGTPEARAALDQFVAALGGCGCH